jgi:hypothetical protein
MILFKRIRTLFGYSRLKKRVLHLIRNKAITNFDSAKSVGILFNTTDHRDFEEIKSLLNYLYESKTKVFPLVYIDAKKTPDFYLLSKGLNIISHKDLNYFFIPHHHLVDDFLSTPFDMLIDLSTSFNFPLYYIAKLSIAKYKIGRLIDDTSCYDLMIDTESNNTVKYLIEQISYYTKVLAS